MKDATTQETLSILAKMLAIHAVPAKEALEAAYQMGWIDGGIRVASAGQELMAEVLREAA